MKAGKHGRSRKPKPGSDNPWGLTELPVHDLRVVCWGRMPTPREQKVLGPKILKNAWLSQASTVTFVPVDDETMNKAKDHRSKRGGVDGGT